MRQKNKIKNSNVVQSNININGAIKCGGSLRIGCLDGDTSNDEAPAAAKDDLFNFECNDFHSESLIVRQNGEIYINGEKQPKIPKLFGGEYIAQDRGKVYINGREKKNGEWKLTLRAIAACLFG